MNTGIASSGTPTRASPRSNASDTAGVAVTCQFIHCSGWALWL